jgi:hypothetical protein
MSFFASKTMNIWVLKIGGLVTLAVIGTAGFENASRC